MKDDDKNKKSRASEIIRMIRERQKDSNKEKEEPKQQEIPQSVREIMLEYRIHELEQLISNADPGPTDEDKLFHSFKELRPAMNSMGLYREIMEEIEFETDPKILKTFFADILQQILETIDDTDAFCISKKIKGIE